MRLHILKAKHWLLLALLGMMGFSSCNNDDEERIVPMYGVPETNYNPGN